MVQVGGCQAWSNLCHKLINYPMAVLKVPTKRNLTKGNVEHAKFESCSLKVISQISMKYLSCFSCKWCHNRK